VFSGEDIINGRINCVLELTWAIIRDYDLYRAEYAGLYGAEAILAWCAAMTEGYRGISVSDFSYR
jgi:hypothetical protein